MAERGLIVSNEAIRRWVLKFGPVIAKNLRTSRPKDLTEIRPMNAEPAQMVPVSSWIGGRTLGVDGLCQSLAA